MDWSSEQTRLFRKSWSTHCLRGWLSQDNQTDFKDAPTPDWFSKSDCVGIEVFEPADVPAALDEIRSRGFKNAVFKLDLSASGRGQRLFETDSSLSQSDEAWLRSVFKASENGTFASKAGFAQQAIAVLEPELERVVDLSFLWDVRLAKGDSVQELAIDDQMSEDSENGIALTKYLGWTRTLVTAGRKYTGSRLSMPFVDCVPEVRQFLLANRAEKLEAISNWIAPRLASELYSRNFSGYFGVDAFLFRGSGGELLVKPVVEFNPCMTMGHVALELQKKVAPGVVSEFRILAESQWRQLPDSIKEAPLTTIKDGRWSSGIIRLSEVDENTKLVPFVLIGRCCLENQC